MSVLTSGITRPMVDLLRWYAHAPAERRRRWKERPHPNRAQKLALVTRGLVDANGGRNHDGQMVQGDELALGRITTEGRQLLKLVDKNPRAWMPK